MGRPKKENAMHERITIRLDNEASSILKAYCETKNIEKAEGVRSGIQKLKDDLNK